MNQRDAKRDEAIRTLSKLGDINSDYHSVGRQGKPGSWGDPVDIYGNEKEIKSHMDSRFTYRLKNRVHGNNPLRILLYTLGLVVFGYGVYGIFIAFNNI